MGATVGRFQMCRGLTADSVAGDNVMPQRMVNSRKVCPSPGSKRGLHNVSATDHRIPNVGEVDSDIETTEGYHDAIIFQIAEVNQALL